jgi:molecular chaperone IbpA
MNAFDLTPFMRSTIGFDRMVGALDAALRMDPAAQGHPPYDIKKIGEDAYRITLAVAGFAENELDVEQRENALVVSGVKKQEDAARAESVWLYRGIANREFQRVFQLADYVKAVGAQLQNGLLHIDLVRELPEPMRPRRVEIGRAAPHALGAPDKAAQAA